MIPNPGAFVRMNLIFFRNRLSNLAVSLMRHRANRASTPYCLSEAKSHAGILGNVANAGMLPMSNPNVSGIAAKMAAFQVRRNHNGQDARCAGGRVALRRDRNGQDARCAGGRVALRRDRNGQDARCPSGRVALRRDRNGQDAPLSNGTECGTMSPFPEGEKEMRTMSKTIERPRLDEDVVPTAVRSTTVSREQREHIVRLSLHRMAVRPA